VIAAMGRTRGVTPVAQPIGRVGVLLLAAAIYAGLPATASSQERLIASVESLTAQPVLAGTRVAWVENFGYCVPSPVTADPDHCAQFVLTWSRGRKRQVHTFSPPPRYRRRRFDNPFYVLDLAGSADGIGYQRQSYFPDIREDEIIAEEFGWLPRSGRNRRLLFCGRGSRTCRYPPYEAGGIEAHRDTVAIGHGLRGQAGVLIRDLSRPRRRRFIRTPRREPYFFCCSTRLAGRYVASGYDETLRIYDWIAGRPIRRVRAPEHYGVHWLDVQADGKLAFLRVREFDRFTRVAWVSPRGGRPHVLPPRVAGDPFIAGNRIAVQRFRPQEVTEPEPEILVLDLRGRTRKIVETGLRVNQQSSTQLVDFDGRCVLWTRRLPRDEGGVERTEIWVAPVGRRSAACPYG
jgi:hypothetical protein